MDLKKPTYRKSPTARSKSPSANVAHSADNTRADTPIPTIPAVDMTSRAQNRRPTPTAAVAATDGTNRGRPFTYGTATLSRGEGASAIAKCQTPSPPNAVLRTT